VDNSSGNVSVSNISTSNSSKNKKMSNNIISNIRSYSDNIFSESPQDYSPSMLNFNQGYKMNSQQMPKINNNFFHQ
jgi:hypothetical protein